MFRKRDKDRNSLRVACCWASSSVMSLWLAANIGVLLGLTHDINIRDNSALRPSIAAPNSFKKGYGLLNTWTLRQEPGSGYIRPIPLVVLSLF